MDRPRLPLTWSDWVSGDWLGAANPVGFVAPVVEKSIDRFAKVVNATLTSGIGAGVASGLGATLDAASDLGPAAPQLIIEQILKTAGARLVGRDLTLATGSDSSTMQLHLADLHFAMTPLALAVGQLGTVTANTTNVAWDGGRLNALDMTFANVHLRPGMQPAMVIAPLRFRATIRQDVLDELLADTADKVTVHLAPSGVAYARKPGKEHWGSAQVTPRIEGDSIRLVARGVTVGTRSFNAPRSGIPSALLTIPTLPGGMRLTDIRLGDSCVEVEAVIDEWSEPLTPQQLLMIAELVRSGEERIDLPRPTRDHSTRTASVSTRPTTPPKGSS